MISNPIKFLSVIPVTFVILILMYGGFKIVNYFHIKEVVNTHNTVTDKYNDSLEEIDRGSSEELLDIINNNPPEQVQYCTECNVSILY